MFIKTSGVFFVAVFTFIMIGTISFSNERTKNLQSIVLEDFELNAEGKPNREWVALPNNFGRENNLPTGRSLQKLAWVNAWPEAYFGKEGVYNDGSGIKDYKSSLGLITKFTRRGYNTVDLVPVGKDESGAVVAKAIPFRGKVEFIDFWIWGANYNYDVELIIMDFRGVEHRLPAGNIKHVGWKNFVVNIPKYIPQSIDYIPSLKVLSLVKIVVWTTPEERVEEGAYIYIDHIKYLSDIFEVKYDGYNLGDPSQIDSFWNKGVKGPADTDVKR